MLRKRKPSKLPRTPRALKIVEYEAKAFELRRDGASLDAIAEHLGLTSDQVHNHIVNRLTKIHIHNAETLAQIKAMSDSRLLRIIMGLMPAAKAGNVPAARAVVAVEERRARLLGLDAPVRMELDATLNAGRRDIDAELLEFIAVEVVEGSGQGPIHGTEVSSGVAPQGKAQPVASAEAVAHVGAVNGKGLG